MSKHRPSNSDGRWRRIGITLAAVAFATSLIAVVLTASEALEERRVAVAATDFRLAVLSIAPVTDVAQLDAASLELFDTSMDLLSGDLDDAIHAIDDADRAFIEDEIEMLLVHAEAMVDGSGSHVDHGLAAHIDLERAFRQASIDASADATGSERRAEVWALVAIVMFAVLTISLLRSRYAAQSMALEADAFHHAAQRFGTVLDNSPDATAVVAGNGDVTYASATLVELLGWDPADAFELCKLVVPSQRDELMTHLTTPGSDWSELDVSSTTGDGEPREFCVAVSDLRDDPVVNGFLISISETTSANQTRRHLEHLANHDQLTGLPNRRQLISDIDDSDAFNGLLMIDLDGFKETNDTHGHGAGDQLLRQISDRFRRALAESDRLYRLGGDEFAVLSPRSIGGTEFLADQLLATLAEPIELDTGLERSAASIGVAHRSRTSPLSLLRRADIALYEAKRRGGDTAVLSSPDLDDRAVLRSELSRAFEAADFDSELHLDFQPIVGADGTVRFVEALARWTSPIHGPVRPDVFIPIAETSGRIGELGHWVLDRALSTLSMWRLSGIAADLGVTVNVSPFQLDDERFVERTNNLLRRYELEPSALVVELTESALATAIGPLLEQMTALSEMGCVIACDDFGSGYSNLAQLMALPLDIIKLDRSLLVRLSEMRELGGGSTEQPCQVMSALVTIGEAMHATIVAEGVEDEQQSRSIITSGVQLQQGYFHSRPLGYSAMTRFLRASSSTWDLAL